MEKINKFFGLVASFEPDDILALEGIELENLLMAIARQDREWFEKLVNEKNGAKLTKSTKDLFVNYILDTDSLVDSLVNKECCNIMEATKIRELVVKSADKKEKDSTIQYTPRNKLVNDLSLTSLQDYVYIGEFFKRQPTKRHTDFMEMIQELLRIPTIKEIKRQKINPVFPYVVICTPSGTGKTQLVFSLPLYPVLYFTSCEQENSTSTQPIYQNFHHLSSHLHDAIISDVQMFKSGQAFSMAAFNDTDTRYRTCGFLVGLLKKILQESKSKDKLAAAAQDRHVAMPTNWLLAEIECPEFNYKSLTINQAKQELKEIFGIENPVVLVFLDEVNEILQSEIRFLRSLVRHLKLVFVVMGTNAKAEDFVRPSNYQHSRLSNSPWCYFVHRLPPVYPAYIEQKRREIIELISNTLQTPVTRLVKFVELLFKLLANERPWLVVRACSIMENVLENVSVAQLTDTLLLEKIVGELFVEFVRVKQVESNDDFCKGQIDFLDPRPRETRSVKFIHKHVAYFDPRVIEAIPTNSKKPVDSSNISKLKLVDDGKIYLKVVYNDVSLLNMRAEPKLRYIKPKKKFKNIIEQLKQFELDYSSLDMKSVMPEFKQEPITGLCFTGAYPVLDRFLRRNQGERASCLEKYYTLYSPLPSHNQDKTQELNGMYLEKVAAMSLILASHTASIGDVLTFDVFFEQFIRELQDDYTHKPVVQCQDEECEELWKDLSTIRIPYCGNISAKWNQELFDHLTESGCLLGTVKETVAGYAVDVMMYRGNDESDGLISVECRLHRANVDISQLDGKLNSLTKEPKAADQQATLIPPINILLVRQLADTKNYEQVQKYLDEHKIWLVKLFKDDNYSLRSEYRPDNVERIYIMMDLHTTARSISLKINVQCDSVAQPVSEPALEPTDIPKTSKQPLQEENMHINEPETEKMEIEETTDNTAPKIKIPPQNVPRKSSRSTSQKQQTTMKPKKRRRKNK